MLISKEEKLIVSTFLTLLDKIVYLKRSIYWKHKKRRRASLIRK
jgi:hypothetical protein